MPPTNQTEVFIFQDNKEMPGFLATRWKKIANSAIKKKGYFTAALSGGKNPIDFYVKLSEIKDKGFWNRTHIFLVDERAVPNNHPDSNYRLLLDTFLRHVPIPQGNIHPVSIESENPQSSALRYEEAIKHFFAVSTDEIPVFDFILLGIGEDGHTASLFPGNKAANDTSRLVTFAKLDEQRHDRITLTLRLINTARNIIMLATGANKAEAIRKVIAEQDKSLPATLVKPEKGKLFFLLDAEAASQLEKLPNISGAPIHRE